MAARATVVVGVDGSDASRLALEFAFDEAVRRGAALRVVAALPAEADHWATAYGMSPSLLDDLSADQDRMARGMVDALLDGWGMYAPDPDALIAEVRRLAGGPTGGGKNLK